MKRFKKAIVGILAASMLMTGCGGTKSSDGVKLDNYMKMGEYKGVEVSKADIEIKTNDTIKQILDANSSYEEITTGKVKNGDTVNIDYVGKKDGEAFDNGTAQGQNLEIGSNRFIPGFEDGLVGKKVGETCNLNLTFPEDYGKEELNGQKVVFEVTINYIQGDKIEREFDDAFVKEFYPDYANAEEYKQEIQSDALAELAWDQVAAATKVDSYPEKWLNEKVDQLFASYKQMMTNYGISLDDYLQQMGTTEENYKEETLKPEAEQYTKQKMIAEYIASKEKISVSDEDVNKEAEQYMASYGFTSTEEFFKDFKEKYNYDMEAMMKENLLLQKVQKFISENAKETDKEASITPMPAATPEAKTDDTTKEGADTTEGTEESAKGEDDTSAAGESSEAEDDTAEAAE